MQQESHRFSPDHYGDYTEQGVDAIMQWASESQKTVIGSRSILAKFANAQS